MKWSGAKTIEPESDQASRTEPATRETQWSVHMLSGATGVKADTLHWKQARLWMGALQIRKRVRDAAINHTFLFQFESYLKKKTSY